MIQLNDLHQSTVDASKIVDIEMRDLALDAVIAGKEIERGLSYAIKCKLADESVLSFVYSGKDALHFDYKKLLIATNS